MCLMTIKVIHFIHFHSDLHTWQSLFLGRDNRVVRQ